MRSHAAFRSRKKRVDRCSGRPMSVPGANGSNSTSRQIECAVHLLDGLPTGGFGAPEMSRLTQRQAEGATKSPLPKGHQGIACNVACANIGRKYVPATQTDRGPVGPR